MHATGCSTDEAALRHGSLDSMKHARKGNGARLVRIFASSYGLGEKLLGKGASTEVKDKYGCTALMYAGKNGHGEVVEMLRSKSEKEQDVTPPLHPFLRNHKNAMMIVDDVYY